jgi:hypothetical protein
MIKKLILTLTILVAFVAPALALQPASAVDVLQGPCNDPNAVSKPEVCKDNQTNSTDNPIFGPNGILTVAVRILSLIVGIVSVIIIVVEGFRTVLAGSDAGTAAQARRGIVWACVGLVIALISQSIIALVLNKL